jgi:hypothetical protein
MRGNLIPTTVYLDKPTKRQVDILAAMSSKPKAEIIRDVLAIGLQHYKAPKNGARALLEFADKARTILKDERLPQDLSTNHDDYFSEGEVADE